MLSLRQVPKVPVDVPAGCVTQEEQQVLNSEVYSHELADTGVGNEVAASVEELLCANSSDVVGEYFSGSAPAPGLPGKCTVDVSTVLQEPECADEIDVDAGAGINFTGESSMPAVIREDQHDDFEEDVVIEEWVFFDDGEDDNSSDTDSLVCELSSDGVSGLSGLEVSEIALDASNAMCMSLDETSTEDLAADVSVLETTQGIWWQDSMQRSIWVFDPGKSESWSNYGLGIVCLTDTSIGEKQPVVPRGLTESKPLWQRAIGAVDKPSITPSVNDPPWLEALGALESLMATSVWWRAMKPAGFEGQFLQVTSEGNTLLSVWGINQGAEDGEISVGTMITGSVAPQTRYKGESANLVGDNRVESLNLVEEASLQGGETSLATTETQATQMELEVAGKVPGTILRLRGGGSIPRKRTKKSMRLPGKRQRVGKNLGDASAAIATTKSPVDANFERRCLLGRAELVEDYKDEFNQTLAGMNIDLDWAMFEQIWRETSFTGGSREAVQPTMYRGSWVREVSNLDRAGFLATHPGASSLDVSDETVLDWRETTCEGMTSLDFRVAYHILYSKGQDKLGVVDVDDELLHLIEPRTVPIVFIIRAYKHAWPEQSRHYTGPSNDILQWWENSHLDYIFVVRAYYRALRRCGLFGGGHIHMRVVNKVYEMDILRSMWLRSRGRHYPADDTREFSMDDMADLDLLELPWYIANSIGEIQGGARALLREWRRIRKEGGVKFQTIMASVIDNIELVREPLEPADIRAAIIDLRPQAKQRLLSGSILFVRNREEDLNVMLSRLNAIAGWVSLVGAAEFDDYIRKGYERGETGTRSDVDRRLPSAYDVLLF